MILALEGTRSTGTSQTFLSVHLLLARDGKYFCSTTGVVDFFLLSAGIIHVGTLGVCLVLELFLYDCVRIQTIESAL